MRAALTLFLPFILTLPAFAADQWVRLTTPHFELYTEAGEKKGREAILYFEEVRSFFSETSPSSRKAPALPVRIIAFRTEKQFRPYSPSEVAAAFYTGSQKRDYIVMQDLLPEHFPVAIHEYVHLIVRHSGVKLPVWLEEGWADVYSTLKPIGKKTMVGDLIPGRVQTLQNEKWLDFNTLTSVTQDSPTYNEKNRVGIFYSESWALAHMLSLSREYGPAFNKFIAALNDGKSAADACRIAYGKSSAQVYNDLQMYLYRNQIFGALFLMKLTKSEEEADAAPVTPLQSEIILADLLAATNKAERARAAYERLEKENPASAEISESLGYLAWQKNDRNAALRYFEQAFALGDIDPQMCFNLGIFEREANAPFEKIAAPLSKALEVKPDYLEARIELARVNLNEKKYSAVLLLLNGLKNVPPDKAAAVFNVMAYGYLGLGQFQDARTPAESARKWGKTDFDKQQTDQILSYLDSREEAENRTKAYLADAANPAGTLSPSPVREVSPLPAEAAVPPPEFGEENPFVQSGEKLDRIQGIAKNIDCSGKFPRFQIEAGGKVLSFDMTQPDRVWLKHKGMATYDFYCGPQKPFPVAVGFVAGKSGQPSLGILRQLDF
ncbi:MAG: hypothetical protein M3N93_06350 [Acidobacteriota bacterium]|nr:hypothetical protein [Acidobacteriota bacterium]